jgi:hypothetical protein
LGTLASVVADVAQHLKIDRTTLATELFER